MNTKTRTEHDALGPIEIPTERLWGPQTQRAMAHFSISGERMAPEMLRALAQIKRACAYTYHSQHLLDIRKATAIIAAADEIINGEHLDEFPLVVWQAGSGAQTHININEVLANRASELLGGPRGFGGLVHPDDVNQLPSSRDIFPTAMHLAAVEALTRRLLPALNTLRTTLAAKAQALDGIAKIGRTHLQEAQEGQEAAPLTLGQEVSGWAAQLRHGEQHLRGALPHLYEIALGGAAVGTELNTPPDCAQAIAQELADLTGLPLVSAPNKFEAMASCDALVHAHGALKTLAVSLMKITNDVRWLTNGPRPSFGDIIPFGNEPHLPALQSKISPAQCEALTMLCCQVMGNDVAVNMGGALGHFELNGYRPMVIHNFLQSTRLLADGMRSFNAYCTMGIQQQAHRAEQANLDLDSDSVGI